jgi:demethylmenaquinone methyltransferase/2-methoxy-6-polyprenyl-1,4-benzoquinol methylase
VNDTKQAPQSPAWTDADLRANPHEAADKAARVEAMFSSIAKRYDINNRVHSMWRDQAWRRRAAKIAAIQPTDDVLDMACGTGDLSEILAAERPRSVLGMDFTEAMLDVARHKAKRMSRQQSRVEPEFRWGDAMQIDLPDESVDVVTIAFGLRNVSNPAGAVGEFARVLRPGGRLVVLEFSTPSNPVIRLFNSIYTKHIMPCTATLLSGDRSGAYRYLPKSVSTFADPAALASMVSNAGFTLANQVPQTLGICTITLATKSITHRVGAS